MSNRAKGVRIAGVLLGAAAAVTVGYMSGRARASGIPASQPLTYSGTLTDTTGAPLTGTRNIQVELWDAATAGNMQCSAGPTALTLVAGTFRVSLPDSCTGAVHAMTDLWAELFVDGASVGRNKLGAVPFAVEAGNAATATSAVALTGDQTVAGAKTFTSDVAVSGGARFDVGVYVNSADNVMTVNCNGSDVAISGGGLCGPGDELFLESYPILNGTTPVGWKVHCENHDFAFDGSPTTVYVVCLSSAR
jgi:hypothetical protein